MTLQEFAELVREMRKWQILYFRSRYPGDLEKAKHLERQVDREAAEILCPTRQRGLFDPHPGEGGGG